MIITVFWFLSELFTIFHPFLASPPCKASIPCWHCWRIRPRWRSVVVKPWRIEGATGQPWCFQWDDHKMAIEIMDFPMKNGGSFHSYGTICQRVTQRDDVDWGVGGRFVAHSAVICPSWLLGSPCGPGAIRCGDLCRGSDGALCFWALDLDKLLMRKLPSWRHRASPFIFKIFRLSEYLPQNEAHSRD